MGKSFLSKKIRLSSYKLLKEHSVYLLIGSSLGIPMYALEEREDEE